MKFQLATVATAILFVVAAFAAGAIPRRRPDRRRHRWRHRRRLHPRHGARRPQPRKPDPGSRWPSWRSSSWSGSCSSASAPCWWRPRRAPSPSSSPSSCRTSPSPSSRAPSSTPCAGPGNPRMIAVTLVSLALSLADSPQHEGTPPAAAPARPTGHGRPPRRPSPSTTPPRRARRRRRPTTAPGRRARRRGRRHGGGHDESLGAVMMHHVADGYVIEHPGVCARRAFAWNCEWDLADLRRRPPTTRRAPGPARSSSAGST